MTSDEVFGLAALFTSRYVATNQLSHAEVPKVFDAVHGALSGLANGYNPRGPKPLALGWRKEGPAVPVHKSVTSEFIVCLEDGKRLRTMKRYLNTHYGMTPADYRRKWDLPHDYPMVAPAYRKMRSHIAKKAGLGTK